MVLVLSLKKKQMSLLATTQGALTYLLTGIAGFVVLAFGLMRRSKKNSR
jgi:hypothetical protein